MERGRREECGRQRGMKGRGEVECRGTEREGGVGVREEEGGRSIFLCSVGHLQSCFGEDLLEI